MVDPYIRIAVGQVSPPALYECGQVPLRTLTLIFVHYLNYVFSVLGCVSCPWYLPFHTLFDWFGVVFLVRFTLFKHVWSVLQIRASCSFVRTHLSSHVNYTWIGIYLIGTLVVGFYLEGQTTFRRPSFGAIQAPGPALVFPLFLY